MIKYGYNLRDQVGLFHRIKLNVQNFELFNQIFIQVNSSMLRFWYCLNSSN